MGLFRGIGARKDATRGTSPIEVRKVLAGLFASTGGVGARSGILPGADSPLVTGDATWAYNVGLFHTFVSRSASDGGTVYGNDSVALIGATGVGSTVPIAPGAGLSRIDIAWTRHPTAGENGDGATTVALASEPMFGVASGVAASSNPVAPTIPAGAFEVGRNLMTSAATSTLSVGNTITQSALFTGLRGTPVLCRNQAERDALTATADDGDQVWRLDTHLTERYNSALGLWLGAPISVDYRNTAISYTTNNAWVPMNGLSNTPLDSPGLITNHGDGVTIIVPGRYEVQAGITFSVAQYPRGVGVSKNSATAVDSMEQTAAATTTTGTLTTHSPSIIYDCVAGDILRGMCYQTNSGTNAWPANTFSFRAKRLT
jgi:hypothetical protein